MTEEKFVKLKSLKEQINKLERDLYTIERLLESNNLQIEVTGRSTCRFKINRFLKINNENYIKSILDSEKQDIQFNLSVLKNKFEQE